MKYIVIRKKERQSGQIIDFIRRCKMGTLITMAYTAAITFIAVKVIEHTPSEKK